MCMGLGLIFGVMRVINFAQGDFLMLGMYFAFYLFTGLGFESLFGAYFGPVIAAFLAGALAFTVPGERPRARRRTKRKGRFSWVLGLKGIAVLRKGSIEEKRAWQGSSHEHPTRSSPTW